MTSGVAPTIVKLGGELLETPQRIAEVTAAIARLAGDGPVLVVHGGGREIDAECARRGITKVAVDGLRVTDAATLDAVVAVLAGTLNTRLVAALSAAGVRAVGLTGADAGCVHVEKAAPHRAVDGRLVDLGLVGAPVPSASTLLRDLLTLAYTPVLACLGADAAGTIYNVNADTLAASVAVSVRAGRLIFAGGTAGVLDRDGATIASLDLAGIGRLVADGTASAGMVAKLTACRDALLGGVAEVAIVDGRTTAAILDRLGTRLVSRLETPAIG
jgi:acetylglutamate kinase